MCPNVALRTLVWMLAFAPIAVAAQVYKCQRGGRVYEAQYPCPGYEVEEPKAAPPTAVDRRPAAPEPSDSVAPTESPVVRQSNAMIAAALSDGDFAKAERLAVTKEQWEMINAAKRDARKERLDAETLAANKKREAEQAKANARAEAKAKKPRICTGNAYTYGDVDTRTYGNTTTGSVSAYTNSTTICR